MPRVLAYLAPLEQAVATFAAEQTDAGSSGLVIDEAASQCSTSSHHIIRVMRRLQEEGILDEHGRYVVLPYWDPRSLEEFLAAVGRNLRLPIRRRDLVAADEEGVGVEEFISQVFRGRSMARVGEFMPFLENNHEWWRLLLWAVQMKMREQGVIVSSGYTVATPPDSRINVETWEIIAAPIKMAA